MSYRGPKLSQLAPKARANRIAKLAADPATRAAIPDQYLPAKYKSGRKVAKSNAQLAAPGLTVGDLNKQLGAATDLQYGGQERQLQAQAAQIPQWYTDYVHQIQNAGTQQQAATSAAVQGIQNLQAGLNSAAMQQWAGQQQAMSQDAAKRGATVSPIQADQAHNAANIRNALTGSFGAMLLGQGVGEQNFLANRGLVAKQQGVEALGRNAAAQSELGREKADFQTTQRAKLISDAVTADYNKRQAALADAVKLATLKNADVKTGLAVSGQKFDRHKWNQTTNSTYGMSNGAVVQLRQTAEGRARLAAAKQAQDKLLHPPKTPKTPKTTKTTPASGPGSLTRTTEQTYVSQVNTIAGYYTNPPTVPVLDANGKPTGKNRKLTAAEITDNLRTGNNPLKKVVDPRVIAVAQSLAANGGQGLDPAGVQAAHKLGIHVGGNFKIITPTGAATYGGPT